MQGYARFQETHPHWQLTIIGDGDEREIIEENIEALKLQESVTLMGVCSRETVAETLQKCRIFLLTSIAEGFPKVLLEAAACGTPVVATDVGDCSKVSDHAGITIQPRDSEAITAALSLLADDMELWKQYSERGKELANNYQWETAAGRIEEIYDRISNIDTHDARAIHSK